jgi:hypothetical protein
LLGAVTSGIALATVFSPVSEIRAEEPPDDTVRALELALDRRMTVWHSRAPSTCAIAGGAREAVLSA